MKIHYFLVLAILCLICCCCCCCDFSSSSVVVLRSINKHANKLQLKVGRCFLFHSFLQFITDVPYFATARISYFVSRWGTSVIFFRYRNSKSCVGREEKQKNKTYMRSRTRVLSPRTAWENGHKSWGSTSVSLGRQATTRKVLSSFSTEFLSPSLFRFYCGWLSRRPGLDPIRIPSSRTPVCSSTCDARTSHQPMRRACRRLFHRE